jgi:predicted PurR-regulated permease PerM
LTWRRTSSSGFEFLLSIIVAGFLFCPGPKLVDVLAQIMDHILKPRGTEMVQLAGATIRNVSRGVIGVALLQSFLAGAGFLMAGVPGAGILAFASLVLGIVQIGPAILFLPIIVWSWMTMETAHALLFTAYMVPVGLVDNLLRPVLMARGLATPMPLIIIGVIGGTIAYGIIGLFFGPIVSFCCMGACSGVDERGQLREHIAGVQDQRLSVRVSLSAAEASSLARSSGSHTTSFRSRRQAPRHGRWNLLFNERSPNITRLVDTDSVNLKLTALRQRGCDAATC